MKKKIYCLAFAGSLALGAMAVTGSDTPLWLRNVKISPDGDRIAFTYKGDIWTVPVTGGEAKRLTSNAAYDTAPVWSPDGKSIAFASDRHGNLDVFIMDANGGKARRLTSNSADETPKAFTPDGKDVLFSASIQAPAKSAMFPAGRMSQVYAVPVIGGASRQICGTPMLDIAFSPDGKTILYTDVKGFEDNLRKHHTSSESRDVWAFDMASGKHTNITNRPGEDRNAIIDPASGAVYLLSERNGEPFNIYTFPQGAPDKAEKVTDFAPHPVRFLSGAKNGMMAFGYNGEIYTMPAGKGEKPRKVDITVITDDETAPTRISAKPDGNALVSPDGKMVAFSSRGDIFVTAVDFPTTVQITRTPQAEGQLSWAKDSRTLYYMSERDGRKAIWKATMNRKDDANFANATDVTESMVLGNDGNEYSHPKISPDGKKMAYVKNRNHIIIRDLASGAETPVKEETYPGKDDAIVMVWSPDSRWLATEMVPKMHDPYTDIALINALTGEVTDITRNGYFDQSPRFTHDGTAIIYATDKYGMRNHASWGSQSDIMIAFLNREARDKFRLSEEDYKLAKDAEKKDDKKAEASDSKAKDKKKKGKETDKKADKESKPVEVELDGIEERTERLTPFSAEYTDAIVSADGETLYYLVDLGQGNELWKMDLRKNEPSRAAKVSGSGSLQASADGKELFIIGQKMSKIDKGDKLTAITTNARQDIDEAAERAAMYDNMIVEEAERFYDKNMHGVDWPMLAENYRRFLPHINNGYDYAEMLSEILGELNVSHTGGRYYAPSKTADDRTASLGLLYDMTYSGPGLKVEEIVADGPFDKAASKLTSGSVITAVNGNEISAEADMAGIFNNLSGHKTLVEFTTPAGEKLAEVVKPISSGAFSNLLYNRWIRNRAADVERWSDGRLGYVHIRSMADGSFRPMYADLFGKYNNCEGVVVDIRWNGGGRMHEDIEALLTGQKYLTQVIRGEDVCDMPSRRWNKPSIMVVCEACYSNAHGTPWVYQHQKIGKVVGMPVPGTMTSVNWVDMQNPDFVFGIPVIGYRTAEGNYLENTQLEPDVKVANAPETIVTGEDTQLRTAVETLLRDLDAAK